MVAASSLLCSLLKRHPARSPERFTCIFICVFIGSYISIYLAGCVYGGRGQIKQFIAFLLCASIAHIDRPFHPPCNAAIVRESAAKMFCTIYFYFSHAGYARLEFQTEFIDRHYVTNGGIFQKLSRRSLFLTVMPKWVAEISAPSCRRENRLVVYTHTHMYIYVYQGGIYSWTD